MTAPVRTPLGDTASAGDWYVDVWDDVNQVSMTPAYIALMGLESLQPQFAPTWNDQGDFDSKRFGNKNKSGEDVTVTCKIRRAPGIADNTKYDNGQEICRKHGPGKMGSANRIKARIYEMGTARVEAYEGYFGVDWQEDGGGPRDDRLISLVLQGKGEFVAITHPKPTGV